MLLIECDNHRNVQMVMWFINDIRLFTENDVTFLEQF